MTQDQRYSVALINSADPRGDKIGGISTYIRDYIDFHPSDMDLLFIGPDEIGDLKIGVLNDVEFRGRAISFLPLFRQETSVNAYAKSIVRSETFKFAAALAKNWRLVRRILRERKASVEVRRVEFAPVIKSLGVPFITMTHVWGGADKPMSGLLGKVPAIRSMTEGLAARLAYKCYAVNSDMTAMYRRQFPKRAEKFHTLTTWANPTLFRPAPFPTADNGIVRVVYVGRMDLFKRPDIMFSVIRRAHELCGGKLEFHYVGDGDPSVFPEFGAIADFTVRPGSMPAAAVAVYLHRMHIGILTSDFEGMPRFVLETLSCGRPVVALHLPQLEGVIANGESGWLVERGADQEARMAQRIVDLRDTIIDESLTPEGVAAHVAHHGPEALLGKIFDDHRHLHGLAPRGDVVTDAEPRA